MILSRLLIRDFRNIENADLPLATGFNFLVGPNGSGKTSVLEAIYTLGHGGHSAQYRRGVLSAMITTNLSCTANSGKNRQTGPPASA